METMPEPTSNDPAGLRRRYARGHLGDSDLGDDWLEPLQAWFAEAVAEPAVVEANAVQVATADHEGRPSVRTVLAKGIDRRGVVFYTNYDSGKGRDLAANPWAAMVFAWLPLERQVRLAGPVAQVSRAETEAYFHRRPRESQIGAWASAQSQVVGSRAELDAAVAATEARFRDLDIPPPPHWGGYLLRPDTVEFWQGRTGRLHDRLRFRREGDAWVRERLAP